MENENAIIKLTEELVSSKDDYASLVDSYVTAKEKYHNVSIKLERLIKVIINNTKLDYNDRDLTIDNDTAILQLVRFLDPDSYEDRRLTLRRDKLEETEESKEVGKNGK